MIIAYQAARNYTTLFLRQQQQSLRSYNNFNKIKCKQYNLGCLKTFLVSSLPPLLNVGIKRKSSDNVNNKPTTSTKIKFVAMRRLWKNIFGKYLLITNIVGSGVLMVFGDVVAQEIEFRRGAPNAQRYDWHRIGRMFIVGALQGPLHHYVYNWMDKIMPVASFKNIIKKILIDELVMSPVCLIIFFYSACFLEKKTVKETNDELKEKFLFIYCIDWLVWPGAQYINFRYLETKYRVTFVNVCTALYNIFMSYVKHDYIAPL